jgi:hypothetical protein
MFQYNPSASFNLVVCYNSEKFNKILYTVFIFLTDQLVLTSIKPPRSIILHYNRINYSYGTLIPSFHKSQACVFL